MCTIIGANNGNEKLWTKKTATSGKLIKQYMLRKFMCVCIYIYIYIVQVSQVGCSIIPYLLDWGVGV